MNFKVKAIASIVLVAISAHGFAGRNVGFNTYLRAEIPADCLKDLKSERGGPDDARCSCVKLSDRFIRPSPEALTSAVKMGDVFVLTLKTVWMGYFIPDLWPPFPPFSSQYALVSRAFQFGDGSSAVFDYSPESHKAGRVIYFSDDVRPGQFLNFGQIVVAGPSVYKGQPVAISLYAVEVDSDAGNSRTTTLLNTLANIGSTISPVASPVLSVLESVGTSLVRTNTDDIDLRYDTVSLDHRKLRNNLSASFMTYGDYILFRRENRGGEFDYSNIRYKPSDGKLYDGMCSTLWKGDNNGDAYAVFQVNRQSEASVAAYQTYEALKKAIEEAQVTRNEALQDFSKKLEFAIKSDRSYSEILRAVASVESSVENKQKPTGQQIGNLKVKLHALQKAIASFDAPAVDGAKKAAAESGLSSQQIDILIGRLQGDAGEHANEIERSGFDADAVFKILEASWAGF